MSDSNEYPRLVYRKGEEGKGNVEPVWGLGHFEVQRVEDADAQAAALADGWALRPDDEPAKPAKVVKPADASPASPQA